MNVQEGTRAKLTYLHYQGLNNAENSFSQVAVDIRHYLKIYKTIILGVRGFGGTFYGRSPKQYLLGGMDNWLFNESKYSGTTSTGEKNTLGIDSLNEGILFAEFVGMRSTLLGYYLKVDVAWPVKNYEVGNASWFVTLGFDF
jgi:hypothetical protein